MAFVDQNSKQHRKYAFPNVTALHWNSSFHQTQTSSSSSELYEVHIFGFGGQNCAACNVNTFVYFNGMLYLPGFS